MKKNQTNNIRILYIILPGGSRGIIKYHSNQYVNCWEQWRTDESGDVLNLSKADKKLFWRFLGINKLVRN